MWKSRMHYFELLVLLRQQLIEDEDEADEPYIEALDFVITWLARGSAPDA